ncbi:MAG: hypothetical protein IJF75_03015 [Clostridia bacterium]|nr:hypothetical protein [Clostridia bacterium]MBQ4122493.1 hypothetical protein [bacterium]
MNKKKRLVFDLVISFLLVFCFFCSGLFLVEHIQRNKDSYNYDSESSPFIGFASRYVLAEESSALLSRSVTATIYPDNASNQKVDWSIDWKEDSPSDEISNYVTLNTTSDGALTVRLDFYKAFRGFPMVLTCTTRQGGLTASINVIFEGIPTSLKLFDKKGTEIKSGESYDVYSDEVLDFDLSSHNVFNDVMDVSYIISDVTIVGDLKLNIDYKNNGTVIDTYSTSLLDVLNAGCVEWTSSQDASSSSGTSYNLSFEDFFMPTLNDNVLTVDVREVFANWNKGLGVRTGYLSTISGSGYFKIILSNSFNTFTLSLNPLSGVRSVSINGGSDIVV